MSEVKHAPEIVERVARELCFIRCQQGEFIIWKKGCFVTCKDPSACDYWKLGFTKDAIAALNASAHHEMQEALEQVLDDMRGDGLCVCRATKDEAIAAYAKSRGQS